jgi:hypothetical protein
MKLSFEEAGYTISTGRDVYFPFWTMYPPPGTYNAINWDFGSLPWATLLFPTIMEMKNQPIVSGAAPYDTEEKTETIRHQQLHAELKNSSVSHPHSFLFTPVQEDVNDPESAVVSVIVSNIAWDRALTALLPEDVKGIIMVARNDCNQSFTYDIQGGSAYFMGMGDVHNPKYDNMEVVADVSIYTNPLYMTTIGHCRYELVSHTFLFHFKCSHA